MTADRDPIAEAHRQWVRHGWPAAADGMAMVTSVVRVHQLLMERIDAVLRPLDLTFDRYEVQGYVERLRREQDRRVILASITDEGRDIVELATRGLNADVFERPG